MTLKSLATLAAIALLPCQPVFAHSDHATPNTESSNNLESLDPTILATANANSNDFIENAPVAGLGVVTKKSLETPIELHDRYGKAYFFENPQNDSEKYVNQGYAALNVFHYLDAYRCFRAAYLEDNQNVQALVGLVFSTFKNSNGPEANMLAAAQLNKVNDIKVQNGGLSNKENTWYEFAKSFYAAFSGGTQNLNDALANNIQTAFNSLKTIDGNNSEFLSYISWEIFSTFGNLRLLNQAETIANNDKVLAKYPNHAGAIHYNLHLAEGVNEIFKAEDLGEKLDIAAGGNAHAVHMYGHTLPQMGKWQLALDQFLKAHKIHLDYETQYQIPLHEDWHYAHNLDLLAATYLGLDDIPNAILNWEESMKYDDRAVAKTIGLQIATGDFAGAEKHIANQEAKGRNMAILKGELEFLKNGTPITAIGRGTHGQIITLLMSSIQNSAIIPQLLPQLESYYTQSLTSGGFDGWSHAFVNMKQIQAIASKLGIQSVVDLIDEIKVKAQAGTLQDNQN